MAHQVEITTTEIYRKDISSLNIFSLMVINLNSPIKVRKADEAGYT